MTPILGCEDIEAAQSFLVSAFGLEASPVSRDGNGRVVHGEVRVGDEVIWLHRVAAEHGLASPSSLAASSGGLAVTVDDFDTHCDHARAAGAQVEHPPIDQPCGRREYGVRDLRSVIRR